MESSRVYDYVFTPMVGESVFYSSLGVVLRLLRFTAEAIHVTIPEIPFQKNREEAKCVS